MEDLYHHGDLRNELIRVGIKVVAQEGVERLSLRKLASLCKVSEAAPYKHFKSKDDLLDAMQEYIATKLMDCLVQATENTKDPKSPMVTLNMGKAYVNFFITYPEYYGFLFSRPSLLINLTQQEITGNFPPFQYFRDKAFEIYSGRGMDEERIRYGIIAMWAKVHGLAAISSMKNIVKDFEWEDALDKILVE